VSLIHLPINVCYFLYNGSADMRCTFKGLTNLVRGELGRSPLSGDIFIFFNKRRDQIKLLAWEHDGYSIYHKRLEKGSFELPHPTGDSKEMQITPDQLQFILQGVVLSSIQHRKRYMHPA
jgi:transposase